MSKSYQIQREGREEGPLSEAQVSQLFADSRIDRSTPCRLTDGGEWRTVDEFLPMLKYGTGVPEPTTPVVRSEDPPIYRTAASLTPSHAPVKRSDFSVTVADIDLPFLSIVKLLFKWAAAAMLVAFCFIPMLIVFWLILVAIIAALGGGIFSGLHHF